MSIERPILGVTKQSRVFKPLQKRFEQAGLNFQFSQKGRPELLQDPKTDKGISVTQKDPDDLLNDVALGRLPYALVGADKLMEWKIRAARKTGASLQDMNTLRVQRALNIAKCQLEFLRLQGSNCNQISDLEGKSIATSYVNATQQALQQNGIESIAIYDEAEEAENLPNGTTRVVYRKGSVEEGVVLRYYDAAVDIVDTGGTLQSLGMERVGDIPIYETSVVMVSNGQLGNLGADESLARHFIDRAREFNLEPDISKCGEFERPGMSPDDEAGIINLCNNGVLFSQKPRRYIPRQSDRRVANG